MLWDEQAYQEKLLLERLAKKIWPKFILRKSSMVKGPKGCSVIVPFHGKETVEYATFEAETRCFDEDENPLLPAKIKKSKPAFILRAQYNEEMDRMVFWDLEKV